MHQENGQAGFNLGPQVRVTLSGTKVGELLQRIELPPPESSLREATAILIQSFISMAYVILSRKNITVIPGGSIDLGAQFVAAVRDYTDQCLSTPAGSGGP